MTKKIWEKILTDEAKYSVKAVNKPTIKLIRRLKGQSRKIMCNDNDKLRDTHMYAHTRSKKEKQNINVEEMSKNWSDFRMCLNLSPINLK